MRVSKRAQAVSIAQTQLEIALYEYQEKKDLTNVAMLQAIAGVKVKILKAMRRQSKFVPDSNKHRSTVLDHLVYDHARGVTLMTDIEVLQALSSFEQGMLKFMLRYERHGNYDKPAMEA